MEYRALFKTWATGGLAEEGRLYRAYTGKAGNVCWALLAPVDGWALAS